MSATSRSHSASGTVTSSPPTRARSEPSSVSTGTIALPAKSPPRMITSASYTLAAARNLRKQTSDPWRSVAK